MQKPTTLQDQFATTITNDSFGGLAIIGMNWGDGGGKAAVSGHAAPEQAGLFTDPNNRYPYSTRLTKWFELWGHPIIPGGPLDRSISQTNVFLDSSKRFCDVRRDPSKWAEAVRQRGQALATIRPAGVIFLSIPTMVYAFWAATQSNAQEWIDLFGVPEWGELLKFGHRERFRIQFATMSGVPIVGMTHPAARGVSNVDVTGARLVMERWIDEVAPGSRSQGVSAK